jgi:hypothetical protein
MPGAVFHQGAAEVAIGKLPSSSQIHHAIADVGFWLEQPIQGAPVAEHSGGRRANLHETDLSDTADSSGIVRTLDLRHCICNLGRKACLLCFAPDGAEMSPTPWRIGFRHPYEPVYDGRQGDKGEVDIRCVCQGRRRKQHESTRNEGVRLSWIAQRLAPQWRSSSLSSG